MTCVGPLSEVNADIEQTSPRGNAGLERDPEKPRQYPQLAEADSTRTSGFSAEFGPQAEVGRSRNRLTGCKCLAYRLTVAAHPVMLPLAQGIRCNPIN